MQVKWVKSPSAEGLGPGLLEGHDVYISATNVLAKLDEQTGAVAWQQSAFEQPHSFQLYF